MDEKEASKSGIFSVEDKRRNISFPERNEELSEFLGILTGDGFMNEYPRRQAYVIEISGNKLKDYNYLDCFVSNLIKKLFNVEPSFYERTDQNTIFLRVLSKGIFYFLKDCGFFPGKKAEIVSPTWVAKNTLFFRRFIRGVFDTDGYLCLKNKEGKKYPVLGIVSKSKSLLLEIENFLEDLKISSCIASQKNSGERYKSESVVYKLQVSGRKNIQLFFSEIGSNNLRNLNKFYETGDGGNRTPE